MLFHGHFSKFVMGLHVLKNDVVQIKEDGCFISSLYHVSSSFCLEYNTDKCKATPEKYIVPLLSLLDVNY